MVKKLLRYGWIGTLTLLPFLVIIQIFLWLGSFVYSYLFKVLYLSNNTIASSLFLVFTLVLIAGFICFIGYKVEKRGKFLVLDLLEGFLEKVPLIKSLYQFLKEFLHMFLLNKDKSIYKNTVLINFPNKDMLSIGFVTKEIDENNIMVFVPTAPNPTNGFTVIVKKEKVTFVNIPIEEALKIIISIGSVGDKETYLNLKEKLKD